MTSILLNYNKTALIVKTNYSIKYLNDGHQTNIYFLNSIKSINVNFDLMQIILCFINGDSSMINFKITDGCIDEDENKIISEQFRKAILCIAELSNCSIESII